ncbi:MAG: c-type cytochrome domain-containing protein, partial [Maioricimonas sp. JB049]
MSTQRIHGSAGRFVRFAATVLVGLLAASPAPADETSADGERIFAVHVLPLMKQKCFACHGNSPDDLKGELDLSSRAALLKGGESGEPTVVPGKPDTGLLLSAIRWEDYEMPPKENDR